VIRIEHPQAILPAQLGAHDRQAGGRALFLTRHSGRRWSSSEFVEDFVHISAAVARFLAERQVWTSGVDYLSVGGYAHDGVETHQVLLGAGIWLAKGATCQPRSPARTSWPACRCGLPARRALPRGPS
jgi:arylformamidase